MEKPGGEPVLRVLPSVDRILRTAPIPSLLAHFAREPVVRVVRSVLQSYRDSAALGGRVPDVEALAQAVARRIEDDWVQSPAPVINASGVILHTNLGRAPLSTEAIRAMQEASQYSNLEYDIRTGERGSRQEHVTRLLVALTGAEEAHLTVNGASAVLLVLAALSGRKEVIISRGQAVEIGGGFRIPTILRQSGARLIEVGTTNRTHLSDYEQAVTPRTGAILHVHSSNFRIVGFTEQVALPDLAHLARAYNVPLVSDNGSGALLDTSQFGMMHEPTPMEALQAGVDAVAFSGDKLLGGPQAGLILGSARYLRKVAGHPLARVMRPDKLTLGALAATLLSYLRGTAVLEIPVWRMISSRVEDIERRALLWQRAAGERGLDVLVQGGESTVGGGSLPGESLPTSLIVLPRSITAAALRRVNPAIIGRVREGRVVLDLRTVPEEYDGMLLDTVVACVEQPKSPW